MRHERKTMGGETLGRETLGRDTLGCETVGCETVAHEKVAHEKVARETVAREKVGCDVTQMVARSVKLVTVLLFAAGLVACVPEPTSSPPELEETPVEPALTAGAPESDQEDDVDETPAIPTDGRETSEDQSAEPTQGGSDAPTADAVAAAAVALLSERLDVAEESVVVESVEAVEWPSGALGCPEPGQMYTQAIVPGYRVILSVEDETYAVHTDRRLPNPVMTVCADGAPIETDPRE